MKFHISVNISAGILIGTKSVGQFRQGCDLYHLTLTIREYRKLIVFDQLLILPNFHTYNNAIEHVNNMLHIYAYISY